MVLVNYSGKEINAKVVYYGPGLCGKTTNLEFIYGRVPQTNRGKMVSMKTRTERTLFFDFLPIDLGNLAGFQTRFLLYTVPGQVYYNATRKLVLKGVDAVVFVADSGRGKMDENIESFENLRENLAEHGLKLDEIPLVLQFNKRDLPEVHTVEELRQALDPAGRWPWYEAVATTGEGVFETFKGVARLLLEHLTKSMGLGKGQGKKSAPVGGAEKIDALAGNVAPAPPERTAPEPPAPEPPAPPVAYEPADYEPVPPPRPRAPEPPSTGHTLPPISHDARPARVATAPPEEPATLHLEPATPPAAPPAPRAADRGSLSGRRVVRVPVRLRPEDVADGVVIELVVEAERDARKAA